MKTCPHLAPLEGELARRRIALKPIASPYGDGGAWHGCDCTFDGPRLIERLGLPACVRYVEYDGRVAGSDATFTCTSCGHVILGLHPAYAPASTRRVA